MHDEEHPCAIPRCRTGLILTVNDVVRGSFAITSETSGDGCSKAATSSRKPLKHKDNIEMVDAASRGATTLSDEELRA